jgi:hypothetical protein
MRKTNAGLAEALHNRKEGADSYRYSYRLIRGWGIMTNKDLGRQE